MKMTLWYLAAVAALVLTAVTPSGRLSNAGWPTGTFSLSVLAFLLCYLGARIRLRRKPDERELQKFHRTDNLTLLILVLLLVLYNVLRWTSNAGHYADGLVSFVHANWLVLVIASTALVQSVLGLLSFEGVVMSKPRRSDSHGAGSPLATVVAVLGVAAGCAAKPGVSELLPLILLSSVALGALVFWGWTLAEVIAREPDAGNRKLLWVLVAALGSTAGALVYRVYRRPKRLQETGR